MMWNSGSIEVILSLPDGKSISKQLRENSSRFNFTFIDPEEFINISPEQWAKTDVLITYREIPTPELAANLKWIQFFGDFKLDAIIKYKELSPNTIFTSAEGVDVKVQATKSLRQLLSAQNPKQSLYNATIGIIGYDSLGREITRILQPFSPTILAATFNAMSPVSLTFTPEGTGDHEGSYFDRLYPIQALPSMLKQCDFVINTLPLSTRSQSFLTKKMFSQAPKGIPLINATHPDVTDMDSLQPLIEDGTIQYLSVHELKDKSERNNPDSSQFIELLRHNFNMFSDKQPLLNIID
jgi:hypothetical protein